MTKLRNFFNLQFIYYLFLFSIAIFYIYYTSSISTLLIPKIVNNKYVQSDDILFTSYKNYLILPNVIKGANYNSSDAIVLILHISHDQDLTKIKNHIKNWEGFISLSIYIDTNSPKLEEIICTFCKLLNIVEDSENIDIHFVIKMNYFLYSLKELTLLKEPNICEKFYYNNNKIINSHKNENVVEIAKKMSHYPANILRNIARKYSRGKYIVIADMDHMFSKGFHKKMLYTAKRELKNNVTAVLVYRIFEIDYENLKYGPKNKKELKTMMNKKKAFIFHHYYEGAHNISKLDEWFSVPDSPKPTIQHEEPYERFNWEPQFVSLSTIPYHDERFPYPHRDNTNLRWALCMEGYKFLVVNDVFMYHLGLKKRDELKTVGTAKKFSLLRYQKALEEFKKEMEKKFSKDTKKCHF